MGLLIINILSKVIILSQHRGRVKIDENIVAQIYEALTAGNHIKFEYYDHVNKKWVTRHVHPQGLVVGLRLYLIALSNKAPQFAEPIWYRLDRIRDIVQI